MNPHKAPGTWNLVQPLRQGGLASQISDNNKSVALSDHCQCSLGYSVLPQIMACYLGSARRHPSDRPTVVCALRTLVLSGSAVAFRALDSGLLLWQAMTFAVSLVNPNVVS